MIGKLGPNTNKGLGFWTAEPSVVLTYPPDLTKIFRPIYRSLPDQPAQQLPPTWTQNLLQRTLAPAPVGNQVTELWSRPPEYHVQLRAWQWSYNLNLVGKDRLPAGQQIYDLVPSQRPPEQIQVHSWQQNLLQWTLRPIITLPIGESVFDLPPQPVRQPTLSLALNLLQSTLTPGVTPPDLTKIFRGILRSLPDQPAPPTLFWSSPNIVLTAVPTQRPFVQTDWPLTPAAPQPERTIVASYNKNLIGQDKLPVGEVLSERPALLAPALFQTWINAVNLALVTVPPLPRPPFNQFDWPLTPAAGQAAQSWTSNYNQNLVGQDRLPARQQDWQNPVPVQWYRDWSINLLQSTLFIVQRPFAQFDWPVSIAPTRLDQSFTASYNKNLIGQDRLPSGASFTERPQLGAAQPDRSVTASYNRNLIGQDRLPAREQDWPLTPSASAAVIQTWIQAVNLALLHPPAVVGPLGILFNQYAWPLPDRGPAQPDRGFGFFNPNYYPPTPPPPALGVPHNLHFHATLGRLKSF